MHKPDAYKIYIGLMFLNSLGFSMAFVVTSFYEATIAHLSGLQLVLVGTTLEVAILLFEIPTGVVADAWSRRLSIIIGQFIIGVSFIIWGSFPAFGPILLAQVLWGLGYTFTSGATQAWLSDEIGEANANRAFLRANSVEQVGALLGIILAIPLGNLSVSLPVVACGVLIALSSLALFVLMPEQGFHPVPREDRSSWQHMREIFMRGLDAVKSHPTLGNVLGIGLIYGLYSEGWDRLWVKFLVDHHTLPKFFGANEVGFLSFLRVGGLILSFFTMRAIEKRLDASHAPSIARTMLILTGILSASILLFAFSPLLLVSVAAVWLVSLTRNIMGPLYDAWINQRLDSETRATILSMSGQVDAAGQIASGPIAGLVSLWSIRAAITFAGLLIMPALPLIGRANRLHAEQDGLLDTLE